MYNLYKKILFHIPTFFLASTLLSSCSYFSTIMGQDGPSLILKKSEKKYILEDKSGKFHVYREKGLFGSNGKFAVKKKVTEFDIANSQDKILEQSISISIKKKHKSQITTLEPVVSEYKVWFDKKPYKSRIELQLHNGNIKVILDSPEKDWNGAKDYALPKDKGALYCFMSQVIECAGVTGFLEKAVSKGRGSMNFYLIWEGFPFIGEQYINLPNHPFTKAQLGYDGENSLGEKRFKLNAGNQTILYFVNKSFEFKKMYWPAQGLSFQQSEGL